MNFFRRDKTDRRVIDLQVADAWCEPQSVGRIVRCAVCSDSINVYRWHKLVTREMLRINCACAPKESYEPYFPVGGPGHLGALDKPDGCIGHSVGAVKDCYFDLPLESMAHASNSVRAARTRPQLM